MGYIPTNIVPRRDTDKLFVLDVPDMGICFDSRMENVERRCEDGFNTISETGCVKSRPSFVTAASLPEDAGTYHTRCERAYMGSIIMHFGTSLFRFDADSGEVTLLYTGIDDCGSMMCQFSSKLYIYCNSRVFAVDKDFNCTELLPYAPHMFSVSPTGIVTKEKAEDGAIFNLIAPRITVTFEHRDGKTYPFPIPCDTSKGIVVKREGEVVSQSKYTFSEKSLKDSEFGNTQPLTVEYYFKTDSGEVEYSNLFSGCTKCISYGGNDIGGTRIFASGNPDRKGEYCKSKLLDPLYFPMDEVETIGDGCDDVIAFLKVYGYLMIFTTRSVYRMSYTLKDDGGFFSIKHINDTAGCDMPSSVCLCDNRAVFASTREGVFTVDHEDVSGVQNIKPVSGNINGRVGTKQGLLSLPTQQLKEAKAASFSEKYYLYAGGYIYVWDFGRCSYYDSGSYDKSQGRLIWHIWQTEDLLDIFEAQGRLFALSGDGITLKKLDEEDEKAFCTQSSFTFKDTDLGTPFSQKYVTALTCSIYCQKQSNLTLTLYGDGEKYHTCTLLPTSDKRVNFEIALPFKALYRLGVQISCDGGGFELYGAAIKVKYV